MFKTFLSLFVLFIVTSSLAGQQGTVNYLKGQEVLNLYTDENARLYISTSDTTLHFDGINFLQTDLSDTLQTQFLDIVNNQLNIIDEFDLKETITTAAGIDNERVIFTNNTSRLYQLYDGKIIRYLIPDLEEQNLIINKLVGAGDYLLICTLNDGLYIWKHIEFMLDKLNYSQGLETNDVNDALLDDWGNLWVASDYGLKKISYIDKSTKSYPHVTIDKINVLYDEVSTQDISMLDESENSLQFHYSARDYSGSENITFQYRLGENGNWIDDSSGVISLSSLEPGTYDLEVRASNGNGLYGYADPVNFSIQSSSIDDAWKYVLGGVGLLSLLWLWSLVRYNRSNKIFEAEKRKLRLENDLLRTEQKALQLQMNPHFVFNALNSIQGLIASNENKSARKYLNKFSTMMRSMLEQSRGDAITISDEIKYLDDYLSLERMGREEKFDFEISSSGVLGEIKIPTMLVQPFVENAIVHGLKGLSRKGNITVNFKMDGDHLLCEIDDNGVGRTQNKSNSKHRSIGMQVVKDRLSKYSKFKNHEHLEIIDKKNSNGSNAGTKIIINLPQL